MLFQVGGNFRTAFDYMQSWGLSEAILPFFLFFAILFAVLQKVNLFTTKDKQGNVTADRRMNAVISFVISAMIIIPHILGIYPTGANPIVMINNILPASAIIIFSIILILILVGLMGQTAPGTAFVTRIAGFAGVIIIGIIFFANMFPNIGMKLGFLRDARLQALLVTIAIFGIVVYFIVREEKPAGEKKTWKERLDELFG